MSTQPNKVTVKVRRGGPDEPERFDTFEVPYQEGMSVLDALLAIRRDFDPTLAVRYACLNANACKECVAVIDGKAGYLCTAKLPQGCVTCEPMHRKQLLRDLVVDLLPASEEPVR